MDFVRHTALAPAPQVAVIGGTPGDARLGREMLEQAGASCESFFLSQTPAEQHLSQHTAPSQLEARVSDLIRRLNADGYARIVIFCNSLSTLVDLHKLESQSHAPIFSPIAMHRRLPSLYSRILFLTANGQALAGIERELLSIAPQVKVTGIAMLALVEAIENNVPLDQLVIRFGVPNIVDFAAELQVDAIVLACTHFTRIATRIAAISALPVVDTAQTLIAAATE
jgi:glutamate racemase